MPRARGPSIPLAAGLLLAVVAGLASCSRTGIPSEEPKGAADIGTVASWPPNEEGAGRILRVSVHESRPDSFTDENGRIRGFFVDLLDAVAKEKGWKTEYVMDGWEEGLGKLARGEVDLKVSLAPSPERERSFDFSKESAYLDWATVVVDGLKVDQILDLDGRVVALTRQGYFPAQFVELCQQFEIRPEYVYCDSDEEILEAVESGRADAGVVPQVFAALNTKGRAVKTCPIIFAPVGVHLATPKGKGAEVLAAVDERLGAWKADRDSPYYRLLDKWRFGDRGGVAVPAWLWTALAGCASAALLLLAWSKILRAQVAARTRDLKASETRLLAALGERETLIQEIFHRTRNNMAVILALLNLQAEEAGSERLSEAFSAAESRIRAMALAHDGLMRANDLSTIELNTYLSELAMACAENHRETKGRVSLCLSLAEARVGIETAIPCGLVLNELLNNALEHAFPDGRRGEVVVRLERASERDLVLSVSDDGAGIPPGQDSASVARFGLRVARSLTESQLCGRLDFGSGPGFSCSARFPVRACEDRLPGELAHVASKT